MPYYCSDADLTDLLPSLTNSNLTTTALRNAKLRFPASAWIDSVYPGLAPFPPVSDAVGWQVNQTDHDSGDNTITIDGGSTNPSAHEVFRVVGDYQWNSVSEQFDREVWDESYYRVESYSSNVITYLPTARRAWGDNSPIYFGTPDLIRRACARYAIYLAYLIMGEGTPTDAAKDMLSTAKELLQIPEEGWTAQARPESVSEMPLGTVEIQRV